MNPSPTVSPISHAQQWHKAKVRGVPTPGSIPRGGIKGFDRDYGWDVKKGKGSAGAELTLDGVQPCKGSITCQLFTDQDFKDWDAFVSAVLSIDAEVQKTEGLAIYHPALAAVGVTTIVVKKFSVPQHQGKGLYFVTIDLIEWSKPPPKSVVSTPASTAADESSGSNGIPPQDPRAQAAQAQIAALNQAIAKKKAQ